MLESRKDLAQNLNLSDYNPEKKMSSVQIATSLPYKMFESLFFHKIWGLNRYLVTIHGI